MKMTTITREEIVAAENRLLAAQLAADTAALNQLLYDDLIALSPAGQPVTKDMDIDTYRTGTVVLEEATLDIEKVRITGDTAIAIVLLKAKGKVMGELLEGHFRYFRVWKQFEDALKIIGASFMQVS